TLTAVGIVDEDEALVGRVVVPAAAGDKTGSGRDRHPVDAFVTVELVLPEQIALAAQQIGAKASGGAIQRRAASIRVAMEEGAGHDALALGAGCHTVDVVGLDGRSVLPAQWCIAHRCLLGS